VAQLLPFFNLTKPIPVAVRSNEWVRGCSLARIAGSNLALGMTLCHLWVLWVARWRFSSGWSLVHRRLTECDVS